MRAADIDKAKTNLPANSEHMSIRFLLRHLRFYLEYAAVRSVIGATRLLPLRLATSAAAWGWRTLVPIFNPRRQAIALNNLRIAFPHKTEAERQTICSAHWENVGRVVAETAHLERLLEPSRFQVPDQNLLSRYQRKLGPAIGVSLHMGNWEVAVWPLLRAGAKPAAVYRALANPYGNLEQYRFPSPRASR